MRGKPFLLALFLLLGGAAGAAATLDTKWTKAAEQNYLVAAAAGNQKRLPELRVYDERHRLILRSFGPKPGTVGATVAASIRSGAPVAGPGYDETLGELETRDGKPAAPQARGKGKYVIVDYWATWCAPCKVLGAELDSWAARQPKGLVEIVRAETDPIAVARAAGQVVHRYKKGPDGKMVEVRD